MSDSTPMNRENGRKKVTSLLPMNGGNGAYSYNKNSYLQSLAANFEHKKINEEIVEKFDIGDLSLSKTKTIRIADLGCATGPNTIINMQNIVDVIKQKYEAQRPTSSTRLEFQLFFNDLVTNDFNTLFKSFPTDRKYFVAGVPGSFHERIFPFSSLHFVYTSHSLHWLSKLPEEIEDENSPAWNKGRVHYTNAPDEVVKAYKLRFCEEVEKFLDVRSKELMEGGMLVIIMSGTPVDLPFSSTANGATFEFMASILMEMVREGMVDESRVDSFNVPIYQSASPEEIKELVEKNGCFSIERLELSKPSSWLQDFVDLPGCMMHVRAAMEGTFMKHFRSNEVVDEVFKRLTKKYLDHSELLTEWCNMETQLFVVLKRKKII